MSCIGQMVSIVITTRNRARLLERALTSALSQVYASIEVVVVDDASGDETRDVVARYMLRHVNLVYIRLATPSGANAARNAGIRVARGALIAGLDDDDEFTPDRVSCLIGALKPHYAMVTSRNIQVLPNGRRCNFYLPWAGRRVMCYENVVGNQVLIKKERLIAAGLFDERLLRYQDYDMWLRIVVRYGPAKIIRRATQIVYYDHAVAGNSTPIRNLRGARAFMRKHRHLMTRGQRIWQIQKIRRMQGKPPLGGHVLFWWHKLKTKAMLAMGCALDRMDICIGRKCTHGHRGDAV